MRKIFTKARIPFIVAGLILALIPTSSSLASEIQSPQLSSLSQYNGLEIVTETGPGEVCIKGIYLKHPQYYYSLWRLEGEVLPSGIGIIEVLVTWQNGSGGNVTGHIEAEVKKPDGNTSILDVGAGQNTTLSPGENVGGNLNLLIDRSGPWVLNVTLTDLYTSLELDTASANFTVAGISPAFEGDPRKCDAPCSVIFTNLVTGGTLPYGNVSWDFGDGDVEEGKAVHFGGTVTHNYTSPGVFDVRLQVWDDEDSIASHVEVDYITINERVQNKHIWSFSHRGSFPEHLPDSFTGEVVIAELVPDPPDQVQGVYLWDDNDLEWKFWAPGAPGTTLQTLRGDGEYDYMVTVADPCEWEILLP